jgi:hypothetical protein
MATEVLALGLLAAKKWDRATDGRPEGYVPPPDALVTADRFTATEVSDIRNAAADFLADLAPSGWDDWWWSVAGGMVSSLIWAILLIVIGTIALYQSGGDFGDLLRSLLAKRA